MAQEATLRTPQLIVSFVALVLAACSSPVSEGDVDADELPSGVSSGGIAIVREPPVSIGRIATVLGPKVRAGAVACAPIGELEHTDFCLFPGHFTLRAALGRAAFGIEKLGGKVLDHESLGRLADGDAVGGVDLESSALSTFHTNWKTVAPKLGQPKSDSSRRAVVVEAAFWDAYVVPVVLGDPKRVLLGVPRSDDGQVDATTIDHEFLHAQFFESARLEVAVGRCFDKLSGARREAVVDYLSSLAVYDVAQSRLVRNEYFAYALTGALDGGGISGAQSELETCLAAQGAAPKHAAR